MPDHETAPEFPQIVVPSGAMGALQIMFNDGLFTTSNNLARGDKPCRAEETVDGILVKCPNRAVIKAIHIAECATCQRKQKKTVIELCLPHACIHFGAKKPVQVQTEMDLGK